MQENEIVYELLLNAIYLSLSKNNNNFYLVTDFIISYIVRAFLFFTKLFFKACNVETKF